MSSIVRIDGKDYDVQQVPLLQCESCKRVTFTGLCGCPSPMAGIIGETPYAVPHQSVLPQSATSLASTTTTDVVSQKEVV